MWASLNIYLRETVAVLPVTMSILKLIIVLLALCSVNGTLGTPVEHYNEGRGVGSTIWAWLTYPFTWWTSSNDILPESDLLISPTTHKPFDTIEIGKHTVTVWCNSQTCTTRRCDKFGCLNTTCNIYDTHLNGECREYNTIIKPEEPTSEKPTNITAKPTGQDKEIRTTVQYPESTISTPLLSTEIVQHQAVDERPLELEAVLSSTVTEAPGQPT